MTQFWRRKDLQYEHYTLEDPAKKLPLDIFEAVRIANGQSISGRTRAMTCLYRNHSLSPKPSVISYDLHGVVFICVPA